MSEREERFTLLSRGDRVWGRLIVPDGSHVPALVLFTAPDGCAESPAVDQVAESLSPWAAVASIDLPLCGRRRGEKLSAAVLDPDGPLGRRLRGDLEAQLASDLEGTLAALLARPELRDAAVGLVATGVGADLARRFCEGNVGLRASVLAPDAQLTRAWLTELGAELRGRLKPEAASG